MHQWLLELVAIVIWFSSALCWIDPACPLGYHPAICDADGKGYKHFYCNDVNKYVRSRENSPGIKCGKFEICKCEINHYAEDPDNECKCVNPRKAPSFPRFGVIRWNGTHTDDEETVIIKGEARVDSNGNFAMVKNNREEEKLKIIIPNGNGKTFTQFTYLDESRKICKKKTVAVEGSLNSVWGSKKSKYILKEQEKHGNLLQEVWAQDIRGDMWYEEEKMTVLYDHKMNQAIPKHYYYNAYDLRGTFEILTNIDYYFESVNEGEPTFELKNYCIYV